ncbi:MAG: V-type ATPase subunit [Treponema sp.]|jgi:vacuolar-type H+-ATPase subunit C/Vma6|nr:V-type ATPase subunit [Treponema sp.]
MPVSGERAYVYAKACGIIGKSFVGKRIPALGGVGRLSELDRLVFPQSSRDLPERELLVDLENRIIGRAVNQIITIVDSYRKPPPLLRRLVRVYEYGDLKSALSALSGGEGKTPVFTDIGPFGTVNFRAYPDLATMLRGTEFEFLLREKLSDDTLPGAIPLQIKLDRHFYTSLWQDLLSLPKKDRRSAERILSEEISLRNAVWALRLRTYYGMSPEEVRNMIFSLPGKKSLAEDAEASLSMALDNHADWERWRRINFLNPEIPGRSWKADPRYFQNAAVEYLYRLARHSFRLRPFSVDTAFCFIKLKQFEEDLLTSVAEGLGLGMPSREIFDLLEVRS